MATPSPDNRLVQLEAENRRLRRAVEELSIINEVATRSARPRRSIRSSS